METAWGQDRGWASEGAEEGEGGLGGSHSFVPLLPPHPLSLGFPVPTAPRLPTVPQGGSPASVYHREHHV